MKGNVFTWRHLLGEIVTISDNWFAMWPEPYSWRLWSKFGLKIWFDSNVALNFGIYVVPHTFGRGIFVGGGSYSISYDASSCCWNVISKIGRGRYDIVKVFAWKKAIIFREKAMISGGIKAKEATTGFSFSNQLQKMALVLPTNCKKWLLWLLWTSDNFVLFLEW